MTGCDGCGAQVTRRDLVCPICGAALPSDFTSIGSLAIPIRRFGSVPPPSERQQQRAAARRSGSRRGMLLFLATFVVAALGAWVGYLG